jgi:hypothetical protein
MGSNHYVSSSWNLKVPRSRPGRSTESQLWRNAAATNEHATINASALVDPRAGRQVPLARHGGQMLVPQAKDRASE